MLLCRRRQTEVIEPHLILCGITCVAQRCRASILVGFRCVHLSLSPDPQFLPRYCGRRAFIIGIPDSIFPSLYVRSFSLGLRTLSIAVIRLPLTLMTHGGYSWSCVDQRKDCCTLQILSIISMQARTAIRIKTRGICCQMYSD